jgi:hypothetical protein
MKDKTEMTDQERYFLHVCFRFDVNGTLFLLDVY